MSRTDLGSAAPSEAFETELLVDPSFRPGDEIRGKVVHEPTRSWLVGDGLLRW